MAYQVYQRYVRKLVPVTTCSQCVLLQARTRAEAMWQECQWFADSAPPAMRDLPNVGMHYLEWKVTNWLLTSVNNNLADFKQDVKTK